MTDLVSRALRCLRQVLIVISNIRDPTTTTKNRKTSTNTHLSEPHNRPSHPSYHVMINISDICFCYFFALFAEMRRCQVQRSSYYNSGRSLKLHAKQSRESQCIKLEMKFAQKARKWGVEANHMCFLNSTYVRPYLSLFICACIFGLVLCINFNNSEHPNCAHTKNWTRHSQHVGIWLNVSVRPYICSETTAVESGVACQL